MCCAADAARARASQPAHSTAIASPIGRRCRPGRGSSRRDPSSRCAACGAPWRAACRCRTPRCRSARCATTPTSMHWTRRGDYMLRLMRALDRRLARRARPERLVRPGLAIRACCSGTSISRSPSIRPQGLIVPVVRNIENKSPAELRAAVAAQKEAAHQRSTPAGGPARLHPDAVEFRYARRPLRHSRAWCPRRSPFWARARCARMPSRSAGAVAAHRRMPLSLSFDHRCITGGEACRFLAAVIADLEKPD